MRKFYTSIGALCALVLLLNPLRVAAQELDIPVQPVSPFAGLVITEVQPGSAASASEEFIEIYNYSNQRIDFNPSLWYIAIASSTATRWNNLYRVVSLTGSIAPGETYVVASEYTDNDSTVRYLPNVADTWFKAGLSATAGHVRLVYYQETNPNCSYDMHVVDTFEWTATSNGQPIATSIDERAPYVTSAKVIDNQMSLQRIIDAANSSYIDTDNDTHDFNLAVPNPGVGIVYTGSTDPEPWSDSTCVQTSEPSPDPSDPSVPITPPPAEGSDGDTPSTDPAASDPDAASGNENETGGYSSTPVQPQITELLPNPASPQTDAADEYVELFNSGTTAFDISGYTLELGETTKYRYTFPEDTILAAQTYRAFYITETGIGLSNGASRARLLNRGGNEVSTSEAYTNAPEGKAWAYSNGIWQWTATPTPNALNVVTLPAAAVKGATTTKKSTSAAKTASTKAAATKKATKTATPKKTAAAKQPKQVAAIAPASDTRRPIHNGVLAAVGVFAVLYGAYEYRHDLANKVHKFRDNRAARRKNRAGV